MKNDVFKCGRLATFVAVQLLVPCVTMGQAVESSTAAKSPPAAGDERRSTSPAEVAAWVAELDSREYRVRERATRQLMAAGAATLDPLLAAANGDRPEPAERAIWILQKISQMDDSPAALAALQRLVQLRDRPGIVTQAESEIARITVLACKRHLESRGAECTVQMEPIPSLGTYASVFHVRLGENWRGTAEDFRPLADLRYQRHVRLEGAAVDDAIIKLFESSPQLVWFQLWKTKVSVAAIDSLKERLPAAEVYLRNRALMGVGCENNALGARVRIVEPGSAADVAGVVAGDIITAINGQRIPDFDRLTANVAQHEPGQQIKIKVLRDDESLDLYVTLGSWDARPQLQR